MNIFNTAGIDILIGIIVIAMIGYYEYRVALKKGKKINKNAKR